MPFSTHMVPTAPITDAIEDYFASTGRAAADIAYITGIPKDTIQQLCQRRRETMNFDHADKILCAMDMPLRWQRPELVEHYWRGNLPPDRSKPLKCQRRGCEKWFALGPDKRGDHRKFCSMSCKVRESRYRLGRTKQREVMCRNGHKRTATNQIIGSKGERYCRDCRLVAQRKLLKRETPERRAARLAYFKNWHANKKREAATA